MTAKLPIPDAAFAQHTLLLGKTRSGKSSKMRLMVERLLDQKKPVTIVDPKGDWWGIKSSADGKRPGYAVVIFGGEHGDVPINAQAGAPVAELVATGNRPSIIDLSGLMVGERTRFWVDFASTFFRKSRGARWLGIDEVHNFAPQGKAYDVESGKMLHWSNKLAAEGAGRGITLLSASQRPQKVHKDYVTSHETLIALRVIHPLDRNAVKEWIDGCGDPAKGKEVIDSLAQMDRADGWVWSPEIGFGPKRITFPLFSTYDSFAAPKGNAVANLKGWAAVDLDEISAQLATAVEEAKANDPKALKARVAELERQLKAAPAGKVSAELFSFGDARFQKACATARQEGILEGKAAGIALGEKKGAEAAFKAAQEAIQAARRGYAPSEAPIERQQPAASQTPALRPSAPAQASAQMRPSLPPASGSLTGPQMAVLGALAWWRNMGHASPLKNQVAAIVGWSPKGSNLRCRISDLRVAGMIAGGSGDRIGLTPAGIAAAPEPPAIASCLDGARAILSGPQLQVFNAIEAGEPITRDDLAAAVGWEPTGSNLRCRLSDLRVLALIEGDASGFKLQDWVRA